MEIVKTITFGNEGVLETTKTLEPEDAERPAFGAVAQVIRANPEADIRITDSANNDVITLI